ncbi:hypothetical protein [Wenzhouxiangella marina]|uniref:Uncharacterized protein n=1 Tax=Wenzhouxiangella marina TaxID=1579979 RepID=A0A0K0XTR5_9GAMM|nr:hypothetical protein [Wenzhouxiangella marina]AKS41073.1 hypothetical protein WM2015_692 [Wenzhouxiangella marina]MBB6087951.1 hypothetical protein [Wenzhouxiangella marina]
MSNDAFNKLRLGLSSGVVGSALLLSGGAVSRVQAAESQPRGGSFVTVSRSGFSWQISNNTGTRSIYGFGLYEASGNQGSTITTGGSTVTLTDAFDGCESMGVNGVGYADPDGNIDIVGDSAIGDPDSIGGLTVSREFRWLGPMSNGTAIMRSLNNFTNPGTSPVSVTVNFGCNLGSDSGTVIEDSSAGGGNVLVPDDAFWFVSSDGQPYSDPPITHVRYGAGSSVVPYFSFNTGGPIPEGRGVANPGPGVNSWLDNYDITIPAGATVHIVRFIGLSNGAGASLADIPAFTDLNTLSANGLLAGIPPAAQPNILNWAAGAPPAPSFAVPTMGKVGMVIMAGLVAMLGLFGFRRSL